MEKPDIHNYEGRLKRTLLLINTSKEISPSNKKTLLEYYQNCILEGISIAKTERYLYDAIRLAISYKKSLKNASETDLKKIVTKIEQKDWSPHSKYTFKIGLRKLYKSIDKITEKGIFPKRLKWMKTTLKQNDKRLPEDLLNEEEVELLVKNAKSIRDQAFIMCLYESGCRIGEIGTIKIKDISPTEWGIKLNVSGKTGSRCVDLVNSVPYLLKWVNLHPSSKDRENYVWVNEKGELLSDSRFSSILKGSAKRAGITKKVNPHSFRHARATYLAGYLTEAQMKGYLGWTQSSNMPGIYVHLNGRDIDSAILKMNGIKIQEESKESKLKPKTCQRCSAINEAHNKFCKICGAPLDKEEIIKIIELEQKNEKANNLMNQLLEDPEVKALLKTKLTKLSI